MKTRHLILAASAIGLLAGFGAARAAASGEAAIKTVPRLDLDRYVGQWYEIAHYYNWFQRKCTGDVSARYSWRPDGRIDVLNRCRVQEGRYESAHGIARPDTSSLARRNTSSKLEVRFAPAWLSWLPPVWGKYWVIMLDEDYKWAVVSDPKKKYLWILSREKEMPEDVYAKILADLRAKGFDTDKLIRG